MSSNEQTLLDHAMIEISQGHWLDTAELLKPLQNTSSDARRYIRLARNMMTAQQNHPTLYATLFEAISNGHLGETARAVPSSGAWRTVAVRRDDNRYHLYHSKDDPNELADKIIADRLEAIISDVPPLICGIKDGYLVDKLCKKTAAQEGPKKIPVYVAESDPDIVLACFQIHQWWSSRSNTPLTDPSVSWLVGSSWEYSLKNTLVNDDMLICPTTIIGDDPQLLQTAKALLKRILDGRKVLLNKYIRKRSGDAEILSTKAVARALVESAKKQVPRPKALIIGNRFAPQGIQTADALRESLRELGWQVDLLMEYSAVQRMTLESIWQTISKKNVHLLVSVQQPLISDPSFEEGKIPTIIWERNEPIYGASTSVPVCQVEAFSEQHFKMAQEPVRLVPFTMPNISGQTTHSRNSTHEHVLMLENAPPPIEQSVEQLVANAPAGIDPADVQRALDQITQSGASNNRSQLRHTIEPLELGDSQELILDHISDFNHQLKVLETALWAHSVCAENDAVLHLHGNGWKELGEPFASAQDFEITDMQQMGRALCSNDILIQCPDFFSLNEKNLPCWTLGAFSLVRDHQINQKIAQLVRLLAQHASKAKTVDEAMKAISTKRSMTSTLHLETLLKNIQELLPSTYLQYDLVAFARSVLRGGLLDTKDPELLPLSDYHSVAFQDFESFRELLTTHMADSAERLRIAESQNRSLQSRLKLNAHLRTYGIRLGKQLISGKSSTGTNLKV